MRKPNEAGVLLDYLDGQVIKFCEPGWYIVSQMLKAVERSD